jgi:hypothetical protein
MARDSRDRTSGDSSDTDSTGAVGDPARGGVVNLIEEEGKIINQDTGEEVISEATATNTMPDWLWEQHHAGPPEELVE